MSLLPSERPVDLPVGSPKAESDSGDLDSGMGSPVEDAVAETVTTTETQEDSDDEVAVNRKSRSVKVLQDSDSEREEEVTGMAEALILSESSGEEMKTSKSKQNRKGRGKKISRISMGSDESEPERDEPKEVKKKREKSQRRKDKEERRGALMKRLKEKPGTDETPSLPKTLNDSGCLLGDNDLFDAQLEDDTADGEMEEDEESLDAIRDAVKQKAKHKPHLHDFEDDEVADEVKPQRKERKAAKASKEAMKLLHSDSQRLVRESTIGLPYHMPEPKGIDQFFKRRTRPQGPAMALLKSAEYQAYIMETSAAAPAKESQAKTPEQTSNLVAGLCLDEPHPASCTQSEAMTNEEETHNAIGTIEDLPRIEASEEEESASPAKVPVGSGSPTPDKEEQQVSGQQAESETASSEQVGSSLAEPGPVMPKLKRDKLARLRELGLEPPPVAKLCADDGAFVQLEPPQANPALEALKERFLKHIKPAPRSTGERLLNINVVRKDSTSSGQEELHAESITITVNEEKEEPAHTKPGERLVLLKSELQKAMAVRRQEERERRAALYRLDNEDCEEEEEEEMTESEEEGIDELLGDGEEENGGPVEEAEGEDEGGREEEEGDEGEGDNAVEKSPSPGFKSPSPTPYTDGTLMLFAGSSCSRTGDGVRQSGQAGQENDGKLEDEDAFSLTKENSHNSSFELIGSMLPSYQPVNRAAGRGLSAGAFRSPSPCLFRHSFMGSASKSSGKLSEPSLSLPVEDSQDLYAVPSPGDAGPVNDSQGPFSLEDDTHSQLLDADGFLNVGPRGGPSRSHKRQLLLDNLDENAMDANMGELLGLCSGGFGSGQSQPAAASQSAAEDELLGLCSGAFATQAGEAADRPREERRAVEAETRSGESHESSDGDMDQLLALCSGKFTGSPAASPGRSVSSPALEDVSDRVKKKEEEEEEEEEGNCEFRLLSDVDSLSEKEENLEEAADSDIEEENDDGAEDEEREAVFGARPGKRKIRMAEFVDSEAELSGSDLGSEDEDEEGGDEYEEEELQEELPSDEELMDQVNKIHMKQVLDDDKRKLRLYQERYLADGDLHSDGPGRERRFRWKNMDDGFEFGIGTGGEEEEEDDEVDQSELQRRKERLEREQWIREQSEAQAKKGEDFEEEDEKIGEDSQFMKLAKKLTAKTLGQRVPTAVPLQEKAVPNTNSFQKPYQPVAKRGSLLSQPRALLQKLANISDSNPLAPRNTRGFLFQALSPEKEQSASAGPKKQVKKRAQPESFTPVAKRPCRENSVKLPGPPRSVFSYLEN
ncbi:hypothetical protein SRHO_G00316670 [Serrasalmus rhombeus]